MKFSFVKRINTEHNSIFYSLIKKNNEIIGFGRKHYNENLMKIVKFNENFDIIEDNNIILEGEDPRCFNYNNKIYILNNRFSDMALIDYESKEYIKIKISGKNISFIEYGTWENKKIGRIPISIKLDKGFKFYANISINETTSIYVCKNNTCSLPFTNIDLLKEYL